MPVYEYKGVTAAGKKVSGVQDAESLKAVRSRLKKDGVTVLDIHEGATLRSARLGSPAMKLRRPGEARRSCQRDAPTCHAPVIGSSADGGPVGARGAGGKRAPEGGHVVGAGLGARGRITCRRPPWRTPRVFSQLYVNMVSAGETSGTLDITLDRLADFLDEQVRFRGRISAALAYPAFMTVIGASMLFFIFSFVMPRVVGMFQDMKQQLPLITLILLATVRFLSNFWWAILLVIAGGVYYVRRYLRTQAGREAFDARILRMPVFGSLIRMIAVSRFTRTLGTLLESGVPALTALDIVKSVVGNTVLANAIQKARENVREGEPIADPLKRSGLFPPVVVQMVAVGEKSGELEKMLLKISDSFDRTVETRITALMALMEPVIILAMGLIIGFIVIAIMLPMLEMSSGVR